MDAFAKAAATILAEAAAAGRRDRARRAELEKYATGPLDALSGAVGQAGSYLKGHAQDARAYLGPKLQQAGEWASKSENAPIVGALGGAAAGGLAGLTLGATGKRKKSPWATALTGAASGGALGLGIGAGVMAYNGQGKLDPATAAALEKARREQHLKSTTPERFYDITSGDPAAKGDTVGRSLGAGARRNIDPTTLGLAAATGAAGVGLGHLSDLNASAANAKQQFTAGARELLATAAGKSPKPAVTPGSATRPNPFDVTYPPPAEHRAPPRDAASWQRQELEMLQQRALTGRGGHGALLADIERARFGRSNPVGLGGVPRWRTAANPMVGEAMDLGRAKHPALPGTSMRTHAGRGLLGMLGATALSQVPSFLSGFQEPLPDLSGGQR